MFHELLNLGKGSQAFILFQKKDHATTESIVTGENWFGIFIPMISASIPSVKRSGSPFPLFGRCSCTLFFDWCAAFNTSWRTKWPSRYPISALEATFSTSGERLIHIIGYCSYLRVLVKVLGGYRRYAVRVGERKWKIFPPQRKRESVKRRLDLQ